MRKRHQGFTLIEVLIALLIIAIALAATIRATQQSIRATTRVKNVMTAHFVGMNILSQIQTGILTFGQSSQSLRGDSKMLNREWHWMATQTEGSVTVVVGIKNQHINSVTGYV